MAATRAFNLALAQMYVEPGAKSQNLKHACELISQAAAASADIVLLPEALTTGWTDPSGHDTADEIPGGEACKILSTAAKSNSLHVCAGIIEKSGDRIFNSAVLIDSAGEVVLRHRKIYELDIAHDVYALGDSVSVATTPFGRIGVMICADGFAPGQSITRSLALMGADVVLSPCAWAVAADHDNIRKPYGQLWLDNYGPVAREYRVWIAGCSNVGPIYKGPWAGRKCIGCSLVIDSKGQKALQGPYGEHAEEVMHVKITPEPRPARGTAWQELWKAEGTLN